MQRDTTIGVNQTSVGGAIAQTGMTTSASRDVAKIHNEGVMAGLDTQKKIADQNAAVRREQIQATKDMEKAYIGMQSQTRAKLDPETKQQVDLLGKQADSFMQEAKEMRALAGKEINPEKKLSYEDQADKADANAHMAFKSAFKVAGMEPPKFTKTKKGLNMPGDIPAATSRVVPGGTPPERTGRSIFGTIRNADDEENPEVVSTRPFSVQDEQ